MAKQTVGPLVRHLEKGLLAIAGGVFLYAVAMFGVLSPNKVGPDGEQLEPSELNRQVKLEAERLRERLLDNKPSPEPIPTPLPRLRLGADPLAMADVPATFHRAVQFGIPVPSFGPIMRAKRDLVEVVPSSSAMITASGRSGLYLKPPVEFGTSESATADDSFLQDVNWVTVATLFDRQSQEAICLNSGYDRNRLETLFLRIDVQRRTQFSDGTYSEWIDVPAVTLSDNPRQPQPNVYEADTGGYNVSEDDREMIGGFVETIEKGENQLRLMRPLFPMVAYGDDWTYPKGGGQDAQFDVVEMDAEYLPNEGPPCRYPECAKDQSRIDPDLSFRELMKQAEELRDAEKFEEALEYASKAKSKATEDRKDNDVAKAEDLVEQISLLYEKSKADKSTRRSSFQLLWAHDAGIDSLLPGRTYQYRLRPNIYNRYCGTPTLLNNPMDAEKVVLVGSWSDPSEPITIDPDTEFFVRSSKGRSNECKINIFKWVAGVWVEKTFSVTVGENIGDVTKVDTPRERRDSVNFDTGSTVVDIDFRRMYRSHTRGGVALGALEETTALVFVDATGKLHERLLDVDKNCEEYKDAKRRTWDPDQSEG